MLPICQCCNIYPIYVYAVIPGGMCVCTHWPKLISEEWGTNTESCIQWNLSDLEPNGKAKRYQGLSEHFFSRLNLYVQESLVAISFFCSVLRFSHLGNGYYYFFSISFDFWRSDWKFLSIFERKFPIYAEPVVSLWVFSRNQSSSTFISTSSSAYKCMIWLSCFQSRNLLYWFRRDTM